MKSESIAQLAEALSKFQGEVGKTIFDSKVDFTNKNGLRTKYSYATLAALVETAKNPLSKNGLAVSQLVETNENQSITVTTILMHLSGEWIDNSLTMRPEKTTPQGLGSVITYARRYSYAAMLGLVSDEDDDGDAATNPTNTNNKQQTKKTEQKKKTTPTKTKGNIETFKKHIQLSKNQGDISTIKNLIPRREWTKEEIEVINFEIKAKELEFNTTKEANDIPF